MKFEIYVSESKNKPTIFHNIADVNPPKTEPAIESFFNIFQWYRQIFVFVKNTWHCTVSVTNFDFFFIYYKVIAAKFVIK